MEYGEPTNRLRELLAARDREIADTARERAAVEEAWLRLQASPGSWRNLATEPGLAGWAVCEKLCHESAAVADDDSALAGEMAEMALEVAFGVSGEESLRCRVQEYVWMHVGNVLRARGDLKRAEEAFAKARELFVGGLAGTLPSPLERGRLQALAAAVARDKGLLSEALEKIDFGLRLMDARSPGQAALLLEKGRLLRRLGHPEAAFRDLSRALDLASAGADLRLQVRIRIELVGALCDLGRFEDFAPLAEPCRQEVAAFVVEQARWVCLEGRVAAGLGRAEDAREALRKALELEAAVPRDIAVLALDLGALYAGKGRTAELRSLADPVLGLAERPGLDREASAILKLFGRLAREDKLTAERAALFAKDL